MACTGSKTIEQTASGYYAYNYYGLFQTITIPSGQDRLKKFKMRLYRTGSVGTIRGGLTNVSGGLPTGGWIASTTVSGSSVTTSSSGALVEFDLGDVAVTPGAQYALLIQDYNTTNLRAKYSHNPTGGSASSYSGGQPGYKDSGGNYHAWNGDMAFEVYTCHNTVAPSVTTNDTTGIGAHSATGNGNVTSDGGATITERGVCWSTSPNPTTSNSHASTSGTTGSYSVGMTGLSASTTYHVRAYAINSNGTSYGADKSFTTASDTTVPTVTTGDTTNIAQTTATGHGNVTSDGGATITERGICWGESPNPTTSNGKVSVAGTTGAYTGAITGLSPNTTYHVRAYATNSNGTSYGADKSFTTLANPAVDIAVDSIYIEVFYRRKPTNNASPVSPAVGHILSDGTYKLTLGDSDLDGTTTTGVQLVLDIDATQRRGEAVWYVDTGYSVTHRATFIDRNGQTLDVCTIADNPGLVQENTGYRDDQADIASEWHMQDIYLGSDTQEIMLQGVLLQYKSSSTADIPLEIAVRMNKGGWQTLSTHDLPAGEGDYVHYRFEPNKALNGRLLGMRLRSTDGQEFTLFRVGILYAKHNAIQPILNQ